MELSVDQLPQPAERVDEFGRPVELLTTDVDGAWEPCPQCGSGKTRDMTMEGAHERRCAHCSYLLDVDPVDFQEEEGAQVDVTEDEIRVRGKVEDVGALDKPISSFPFLGDVRPAPLAVPGHVNADHAVFMDAVSKMQRAFYEGTRASERKIVEKAGEETRKMNELVSSIRSDTGLAATINGSFPVMGRAPAAPPSIDMTAQEEIELRAYAELQAAAQSEQTLEMIVERNSYLDGVRKRVEQSQEKQQ